MMTETPFLAELALIAAIGAGVGMLLARLRLPATTGLLAAGALIGPHGLALLHEPEALEAMAEVGVVLLLFTVGLELPLDRIAPIFRRVALGGLVQMGSTFAAAAGIAYAAGIPGPQAIFYGFVFAHSSTSIVLRLLSDRGELDAPHGRFIVGANLIQDLSVVPMVLLVPVLGQAAESGAALGRAGLAIVKAALVVGVAVAGARTLVPRLLRLIDASRSREVFLLAILAICLGTAYLTSLAGLSLALGAFLAGLVVAGSEFQHRALSDMIPLRDTFVSLFFISLGTLFDVELVLERPLLVGLLAAGFLGGKAALGALAAAVMRFPPRAAWLAGIGLGQFSEFGFVLLRLGLKSGLTDATAVGPLVSAGITSMFLTPLLIRLAPHATAGERLLAPLARLLGVRGIEEVDRGGRPIEGHVVVIGYGPAGQIACRALGALAVPRLALEMNVETVRRARAAGAPVYYADATSAEALRHAGVERSRAVAVLINDPAGARRVVDALRRAAPEVPVLVRARYRAEQAELVRLGATEVISEEIEGSLEMLSRLLRRLQLPRNVIEAEIRAVRAELPASERRITLPRLRWPVHEALAALKIESYLVMEASPAIGRTLAELDLRRASGALVVAVQRGGALREPFDPGEPLAAGDLLLLAGPPEAVRRAAAVLEGKGGVNGPFTP